MTPAAKEGFDVDERPPWETEDPGRWAEPIDWAAFWSTEAPAEDWILEPVVAAGRQTAIYSTAKTGKSLLALDIAAAGATGRSVLGYPPRDPIDIVYVDLEMTEADLRERLTDLGYVPDDDLSHLHYYQLPAWPALDAELGGEILRSIAVKTGARVVVIDTMARAVSGAENDADTYRNFYRHTGRQLKAAGVALLRLDHQGKDQALGQRGSSAKDDDLDVVFRLTQLDNKTLKLTRTRTRVPWMPAEISLVRHEEPMLRHVASDDAVPAGTHDAVLALDELEVPLDATGTVALAALRRAGKGQRKTVVLAALKARRRSFS
jgi:KaiC/GvpD/RAD55 family RecA-like ATPase